MDFGESESTEDRMDVEGFQNLAQLADRGNTDRTNLIYSILKEGGNEAFRNISQLARINAGVQRERYMYNREARMAQHQERQLQKQQQIDDAMIRADEILSGLDPAVSWNEAYSALSNDPIARILPNKGDLAYKFKSNSIDKRNIELQQKRELEFKEARLGALEVGLDLNNFIKPRSNPDSPVTVFDYDIDAMVEATFEEKRRKEEKKELDALNKNSMSMGGKTDYRSAEEARAGISNTIAEQNKIKNDRLADVNLSRLPYVLRSQIDTASRAWLNLSKDDLADPEKLKEARDNYERIIQFAEEYQTKRGGQAQVKPVQPPRQSEPTTSVPEVKSKSDWEGLPSGSRYTVNGKTYIKK